MHYRPHAFDTQGFFFGMKVLAVLALVLVGVRYGTAYASSVLARDDAAPAVAGVHTIEAAALPLPSAAPSPAASQPSSPPAPSPFKATPLPRISAKSFIVADLDSGEAFAARDAESPYPIASISKLLVALAAREKLAQKSEVTVTKADRQKTEGTPGSIQRDETFTASDLLYPLLMESNNSVAYAIERAGGGDEFVRVMLRIAHAAGMDETLLDDSSGLSPRNRASARDLLSLARHIMQEAPDLFEITRTRSHTLVARSGRAYPSPNLNVFSSDPSFLGGKTGYTDEAKQTMIALFDVDGTRLAIIVLGSSDRKGDVEKLRTWYERAAGN